MFRALVCLALLLAATQSAHATMFISGINEKREIEFTVRGEKSPKMGDRLIIRSAHDGSALGYAIVNGRNLARVISHSENTLILVGDKLSPFNLMGPNFGVTGRADLLLNDERGASSRYKKVFFQALGATQTAETLERNEYLIGLTSGAYGVSNHLTLSSVLLANFLKIPNLQAKWKFLDMPDWTFSASGNGYWFPDRKGAAYQVVLYFDSQTNGKFISHTAVTFNYSRFKGEAVAPTGPVSSSIQSGYEYILDNWDRILISPKYNIETKNVGAVASYLLIWNHLHLSLGLLIEDFSKLNISSGGYLPTFEVYWRF